MLDKLAEHNFENVTPELRESILAFYSTPATTEKDAAAWQKTQDELQPLKDFTPPPQNPATKLSSAF